MKITSFTTLLTLMLLLSNMARSDYPIAPDLKLLTQNGVIELSDLKGKLVYINFWASWCRPCKESFPWLIEMKEKFKKHPFEIISINLDIDKSLADKFISTQDINFPIAFDPDAKVANEYGIEGMPSSYLIDDKGQLRLRYIGFWNKSRKDNEKIIHDLLEEIKVKK